MRLRKTFRFEASHILPKHPGKCSRLHGHSWVLHVEVSGEIDPQTGFVCDYADIKTGVQPVIEALDHRHLGQWVEGVGGKLVFAVREDYPVIWNVSELPLHFYPSSENLLHWIGHQLLLTNRNVDWSALELEETCTSSARLERSEFDTINGF